MCIQRARCTTCLLPGGCPSETGSRLSSLVANDAALLAVVGRRAVALLGCLADSGPCRQRIQGGVCTRAIVTIHTWRKVNETHDRRRRSLCLRQV